MGWGNKWADFYNYDCVTEVKHQTVQESRLTATRLLWIRPLPQAKDVQRYGRERRHSLQSKAGRAEKASGVMTEGWSCRWMCPQWASLLCSCFCLKNKNRFFWWKGYKQKKDWEEKPKIHEQTIVNAAVSLRWNSDEKLGPLNNIKLVELAAVSSWLKGVFRPIVGCWAFLHFARCVWWHHWAERSSYEVFKTLRHSMLCSAVPLHEHCADNIHVLLPTRISYSLTWIYIFT